MQHILSVIFDTFSIPLILLIILNVLMLVDTKQKGQCEYKDMKKIFLYWLALTIAYLIYEFLHA